MHTHSRTHSRTHWHLLVHRHQFDRGHASDASVAHNGHQGQGRRGTRGQVLLHVGVERADRRLVGHVDQDLRGKTCAEELASWRAAPAAWGGGRAAVAVRGLATLATQTRAGTRVSMPSALSEAMSDSWLGLGSVSGLGSGLGCACRCVHLPTASVHHIALFGQCQRSVPPDALRGARHDDAAALVHRVLLTHSEQQQLVQSDERKREQRGAQHL